MGKESVSWKIETNYSKCISEEKVTESMTVRIRSVEENREAWHGLTGAIRKEHRGGGESQWVRHSCPETFQIYEETSPHLRKLNKFWREIEKKSTGRGRVAKHKEREKKDDLHGDKRFSRISIKVAAAFSRKDKMEARKKWNSIFKVLKENNYQSRIVTSLKYLPITRAKLNTFRKKLRGCAHNQFSLKGKWKPGKFEVQEGIISKDEKIYG